MSKSRELADVIGTQNTTENVLQGRRNLIINGAMQVWQRGTSGSGGGYKSADRWFNNFYSAGTCTTSRRTDATGQNFTEYARVEQSVAGTVGGQQALFQIIEGTYAVGKTITVSFMARASKTLTNCRVRECYSSPQTFTMTTDWQRFTFTGTCVESSSNVRLNIDLGLNNDTWYADIAEVQLEIGSVATPFEHRSYGEELALCERYFQKRAHGMYNDSVSGSNKYLTTSIVPSMRTAPSATVTGTAISGHDTGTTVTPMTNHSLYLYRTGSYSVGATYNLDAEL